MIKTVKIGNKEVVLDNNIGWAFVYKDQFGTDIIPSVMPLLASTVDIVAGIVEEAGDKKEFNFETIAKISDSGKLEDAFIKAASYEFTDFINIVWALAKNADDSIPEPREWIRQFDEFPVDVIGPEVFKLIFRGVVSSKNRKRMNGLIKNVHPTKEPSTSTQSSLPESNED